MFFKASLLLKWRAIGRFQQFVGIQLNKSNSLFHRKLTAYIKTIYKYIYIYIYIYKWSYIMCPSA